MLSPSFHALSASRLPSCSLVLSAVFARSIRWNRSCRDQRIELSHRFRPAVSEQVGINIQRDLNAAVPELHQLVEDAAHEALPVRVELTPFSDIPVRVGNRLQSGIESWSSK